MVDQRTDVVEDVECLEADVEAKTLEDAKVVGPVRGLVADKAKEQDAKDK